MTSQHDVKWQTIARRVASSDADRFDELVKRSGLDPARDLRFADLSGVDFSDCDLRGFDFTGARLHNCRFNHALIKGARFDGTEFGAVSHVRKSESFEPAVMTAVADISKAGDWLDYVRDWTAANRLSFRDQFEPGTIFCDGPGPEMVVVPAGTFMMGASPGETTRQDLRTDYEYPRHLVTIAQPFAVGRFAVTFDEWDLAQGHPDWHKHSGLEPRRSDDMGWGRGRRPIIDVDWDDARAYCRWLATVTEVPYRLLSEAEWEYCCRAGTATMYGTGDNIARTQTQLAMAPTSEVGLFPANSWGLHDMHGNVWEWCQDAWHSSYVNAPADGSAWEGGAKSDRRVIRGGAWQIDPHSPRPAHRIPSDTEIRNGAIGFRIARTLTRYERPGFDVFLVYAREDADVVRVLEGELVAAGFSVWDHMNIGGTERYGIGAAVDSAKDIDSAKVVVVLWSKSSIKSDWVISEARLAHLRDKLVPLRLATVANKEVPPPFNMINSMVVPADLDALKRTLKLKGAKAQPTRSGVPNVAVPGEF